MATKKKIALVTGSRSEYGILRPVLREIARHPKLMPRLIVAGMHLRKEFGNTIKEIRKDGFMISATVPMTPRRDSSAAMALSIGIGIEKMVQAFEKLKPDTVLVLGDRTEALAAAIASSYMNIPVAHVHGGERSGTLDENARHAITKFAHTHFAATKESMRRIRKMGEQPERIHLVGAPGLDDIKTTAHERRDALSARGIACPFIFVSQHPNTTEPKRAAAQMQETLEALVRLQLPACVVYPNADAGARHMIKILKKYLLKYPFIHAYPSLPRREYLALAASAAVFIGNSSSGIIEVPVLGVPVINIGDRQRGREQAPGISNVPHERKAILRAIKKGIDAKRIPHPTAYGKGGASKKIAAILARNNVSLEKSMTY